MINILHISDLHFPIENSVTTEGEFIRAIGDLIDSISDENLYLLISGDITFQGKREGYEDASRIFKKIIGDTDKIKADKILLCPGNHDIVLTQGGENAFSLFDAFSFALTNNKTFTFSQKNNVIYESEDAIFLIVNSSYNMDHKYGYVDIPSINNSLKSIDTDNNKVKVAIVHHHLINQHRNDTSVLRNAYQFLKLLQHYNFEFILHGHQHSNMESLIDKISVFGISTPVFKYEGYTNGVSYYQISNENVRRKHFVFSKDNLINGIMGGYRLSTTDDYPRR